MELATRSIGNVHIFHLRGRFVMGPAVDCFRSTSDTYLQNGGKFFVVSLQEVLAMDSMGIAGLIRLLTSSRNSGGDLKLVEPSNIVVQTLKVTGLLNFFALYPSEEAAAASFSHAADA
jgi:anti-sigma B factor antagonist